MKMERTDSSKMSEATYGSKRCEKLEDYKINLRCLKNLKFYTDSTHWQQKRLSEFSVQVYNHLVPYSQRISSTNISTKCWRKPEVRCTGSINSSHWRSFAWYSGTFLDKTAVRIFRVVAVLKTDGALSSEILVIFSQTTRRHIPQQNIFIVTNMRTSTFTL